jgi:hypothetical protein
MMQDPKVYVALGFHTSFHHSWRGDTPDEAGFGTDIRVVRGILDILDRAGERQLQVRAYWDFDVYWTLQTILPRHAPDIVDRIRQRVTAGRDEIVLGPYNNGANHAATEHEFRAALRYAIENPFGSGLKQVFGHVTSLYRPQESMLTAGQNAILMDEGISGLVLYYAAVPFNALSTFVPALAPERRYNPLSLRCQPGEPAIPVLPCISPADLVEEVCLEALLLKLRRLQTSGRVSSDSLVHLNFDADGETWLPAPIPRAFAWFPNTGGLEEYIQVVNRYPWAEFVLPSAYLRDHPPGAELLVRQDLADGGFDGNYSWAEKCTSLQNWTLLERSRLHTYRAETLARRLPGDQAAHLHERLWEGEGSAFFPRLVGLTTTHFGMSTPVINEQRQAGAERILGSARTRAATAERNAALAVRDMQPAASVVTEQDLLYEFEVYRPLVEGHDGAGTVPAVVRLPVVLPAGAASVRVTDDSGAPVAASLVDVQAFLDGSRGGELMFIAELRPGDAQRYRVVAAPVSTAPVEPRRRLQNRWLDLCLGEKTGIASLSFHGWEAGGDRFLDPFITYRSGRRPRRWVPTGYTFESLGGEAWAGLARARLRTQIAMDTPHGPAASELRYTFTLFDDLPYLLADVEVDYARTVPSDRIQTLQQKLHRTLDLRWIEVAPFQIVPALTAPADRPLRVWKHNYLGVTSCYNLDYGHINPRNQDLDSFNHQVTAGWVAVSDGQFGLLVAENAESLASLAFCPMRLRQRDGRQHVALNPFGSYYGRQLDYRHLGGNGIGARFTAAVSGSLRPNGPSFNGQQLRFSLLLAPYEGDAPPESVQAGALAHFYPPGAIILSGPPGIDAAVPADLTAALRARRRARECQRLGDRPLPVPEALCAGSTAATVELVWDLPRDPRITGCEVRWREVAAGTWRSKALGTDTRHSIGGLRDGQRYSFQVRATAADQASGWTSEVEAVPGSVPASSLLSAMPGGSPLTLLRMVGYSLAHVLRARLARRED